MNNIPSDNHAESKKEISLEDISLSHHKVLSEIKEDIQVIKKWIVFWGIMGIGGAVLYAILMLMNFGTIFR